MVHLAYDRTKMRNLMISLVGIMYKAATLELICVRFRVPQNYNYTAMEKKVGRNSEENAANRKRSGLKLVYSS